MTENKNLMELCPQLQGILKDTYGVIVYQEQVMKIVQELGGFSMGRADLVRKAMSKKKKAVIEEERQNFVYGNKELGIPGCIANGISEEVANHIYDKMESFAAYAFNKSHAVAYANTSYIAAWLKYHYPAYYLCEVMNYADKIEDIQKSIEDAREFGIKVLPPRL
jgi:DNA polymerase-3 subunit alpha